MDLKEFVKFTFEKYAKNGYCFRPRIVCNDGFSMSVQGSNLLRILQTQQVQFMVTCLVNLLKKLF